jgi:iron complex outermembrane receptor protein
MRTVKMLLAFALFFCIHAALAQTRFTGRVTDSITGSPLEGVSIKIKSSKAGTTSNKDGVFSIQVSSSDVLVFSYVGYTDQEVNVNDQTNIEVKLVPVITDLDKL